MSDELTQSADVVAERGRAEGEVWLGLVWRRTVIAVWGVVVVLLLVQTLTAIGAGWTAARTAGLVAAVVVSALLTGASWFHRARGGVLAPVIGEDNRLSTSRAVAVGWVLFVVYAVLVLAGRLAGASSPDERDTLIAGLDLARGAGIVTVLAVVCAIAVLVRRVVGLRVLGQRLQKVRADRPRAADLLTDDSGRGSFADIQYVVVGAVALVFAAVRLARRPEQLPDLPWGLAVMVLVSAATYVAGKYAEGGRPVILSVVRAREAGTWTRRSGPATTSRSGAPDSCRPARRARTGCRGWWCGSGPCMCMCRWFRCPAGSATRPTRCSPCRYRRMWSPGGWTYRSSPRRGWRRTGWGSM